MNEALHVESTIAGYFDVDARLCFSPAAYWRTFQDAAAAHATKLSAATEKLRCQGMTWMLSRMAVEVGSHPVMGDGLRVETWPSTKLKGVRAYRDFVIKNARGEILASATSLWVMVDLATRKPLRIPAEIVKLRHDPGYVVPLLTDKLAPLGEGTFTSKMFRAEWSDCDQNEHVNNVTYIRWAVDAVPRTMLESCVMVRLEAHYLREVELDQTVEVRTNVCGGCVRQELRVKDAVIGTAVAHVESLWRLSPQSAC